MIDSDQTAGVQNHLKATEAGQLSLARQFHTQRKRTHAIRTSDMQIALNEHGQFGTGSRKVKTGRREKPKSVTSLNQQPQTPVGNHLTGG